MVHRNARLTPAGRKILVGRIAAGSPPAHVAAQMGCPARPRTSVGESGAKKARPVLEDRLSTETVTTHTRPRPRTGSVGSARLAGGDPNGSQPRPVCGLRR